MRSQLVKFRTAQINGLRGLLTESGEVMPQSKAGVRKGIAEALARLSHRLPAMVIDTLREQWVRIEKLDGEIATIEQRIKLLGISKRGDTYLRTLLMHGARSVLTHAKDPGPWVTELRQRRPLNVSRGLGQQDGAHDLGDVGP
jgi:transposase